FGVEAWQEGGRRGWRGRMADFSLAEVDPRLDPHGLDRSARFLTAASAFALRDAGIRLTRRDRESAGLVFGSLRPSPESVKSFGESVEEHGLSGASAPAFARIVLNAPAGFCAKLLSIQGPLTAVTVGSGSGLAAILVAAEQLRRRPDVAIMLGAAVDELADDEDEGDASGEGSACAVLSREETRAATDGPVLAAWALAGPGRLDDAVERALAEAEGGDGVDAIFEERTYGGGGAEDRALPSALAFVAACAALRTGEVSRALVTSASGDATTMAALLHA
ncbi:MAG: beta-ketoacyl synthase N-terminal-like domain-containing protein, partial [Longimicrobiales bacterium]|nr:beta-ketoacyl synthase N-terminal-like domain-containing protein [Longimicrobiales bacterium]